MDENSVKICELMSRVCVEIEFVMLKIREFEDCNDFLSTEQSRDFSTLQNLDLCLQTLNDIHSLLKYLVGCNGEVVRSDFKKGAADVLKLAKVRDSVLFGRRHLIDDCRRHGGVSLF